MASHQCIDIPFNSRHTCWFCGEPSHVYAPFPNKKTRAKVDHQSIEVPSCDECFSLSQTSDASSVLQLQSEVKHGLLKKHSQALAVGLNWTKEELEESEFTGAALEGFRRSAWAMYEIAKARIDYQGWPLSLDDMPMEIYDETSCFEFDGMRYLNLNACIDHYATSLSLDKPLLEQLTDVVGIERLSYAIQIAKLNPRISEKKRNSIVQEIEQQELERAEARALQNQGSNQSRHEPEAVLISGVVAEPDAIAWLVNNKVTTLAKLIQSEDDFFDAFQHLGGVGAFAKFNGVQLYLEARQDESWVVKHDINKSMWDAIS